MTLFLPLTKIIDTWKLIHVCDYKYLDFKQVPQNCIFQIYYFMVHRGCIGKQGRKLRIV